MLQSHCQMIDVSVMFALWLASALFVVISYAMILNGATSPRGRKSIPSDRQQLDVDDIAVAVGKEKPPGGAGAEGAEGAPAASTAWQREVALPLEVWVQILTRCDLETIRAVAAVCTVTRSAVVDILLQNWQTGSKKTRGLKVSLNELRWASERPSVTYGRLKTSEDLDNPEALKAYLFLKYRHPARYARELGTWNCVVDFDSCLINTANAICLLHRRLDPTMSYDSLNCLPRCSFRSFNWTNSMTRREGSHTFSCHLTLCDVGFLIKQSHQTLPNHFGANVTTNDQSICAYDVPSGVLLWEAEDLSLLPMHANRITDVLCQSPEFASVSLSLKQRLFLNDWVGLFLVGVGARSSLYAHSDSEENI